MCAIVHKRVLVATPERIEVFRPGEKKSTFTMLNAGPDGQPRFGKNREGVSRFVSAALAAMGSQLHKEGIRPYSVLIELRAPVRMEPGWQRSGFRIAWPDAEQPAIVPNPRAEPTGRKEKAA